jgi:hypothetical protein
MGTSNKSTVGPEIDECVDELIERVFRAHVKNLMNEHVRLQGPHEEQRRGPRIAHTENAGLGGATEVLGHDLQSATRRCICVARIERQHDRRLTARIHVDSKILRECALHERDELLCQIAQHLPRILRGVNGGEIEHERRHRERMRPHRSGEQGLLCRVVAKNGRSGDLQLGPDVGERCLLEAFRSKDATRGVEHFLAVDRRWAAHL